MTAFTVITLPTDKLSLPYKISSSLSSPPKINPLGYASKQNQGFYSLKRILTLSYVGLTEAELSSFDVFDLQSPYTIFSIQLSRTLPYKLAKPQGFTKIPKRKILDNVTSIVYDLSFSCRILE